MPSPKPVALAVGAALALETLLHPEEARPHVDVPEHHAPRPVGNFAIDLRTSTSDMAALPWTHIIPAPEGSGYS